MNKITLGLIALFIWINPLLAADDCLLEQKAPRALVVDQADILAPSEEQRLERKLVDFSNSTTTQILVVTVADLCGYDAGGFTFELGEKWGVGDKKFDNGIVVMVKPTGGKGQRKTFIATGYGLEGVIPDAIAKRIIEKEMIPRFAQGQFYGGIDKATSTLMSLALGEYSAKEYQKRAGGKGKPVIPLLFVILIIIFLFVSRVQRARRYSMGHDVSFWTALWLLNSSNRRGGGWGNFNSGGGSFGGFGGGGGFGGFGGGSFGGGGAGGSW